MYCDELIAVPRPSPCPPKCPGMIGSQPSTTFARGLRIDSQNVGVIVSDLCRRTAVGLSTLTFVLVPKISSSTGA